MKAYVLLLRGINVGGKNKISMAELKLGLEKHGLQDVITYINSGNIVLRSSLNAKALRASVEALLPKLFKLDSTIIKIAVLDYNQYQKAVHQAPKDFGIEVKNYRYYVLFPMGITPGHLMQDIDVRPGVDTAWCGDVAVYYRLPSLSSPNATKSYLNKIIQKPVYKLVTMRNWNTTKKLRDLLEAAKSG